MPPAPSAIATRGVRRPTPGAPAPRVPLQATAPRSAPPVPEPDQPVTQEQVSLSLLDIVEELANHVPATLRPQVDLLVRFAREKPGEQAKLKQQMLTIAGADAMRAAVGAVLSKGGSKPSAAPAPAPAPAAPAPVCPPVPVWGGAGVEPVSYTHLTLPTICSV